MQPPSTPAALLFAYAFLSNVALAVVPHEPAINLVWARLGLWTTTLVATAGTMLAAVVDHGCCAADPPHGATTLRASRGEV